MINQYDSDTQWGQGQKDTFGVWTGKAFLETKSALSINHFKQVVSSYKLAIAFQGIYPVEILI